MSIYRAKYDAKGNKVYEESAGVVLIDNMEPQGRDAGYYVMGDIQPYKSTVTGEQIMGRAQHKDHLKRHRLIEVGNEPIREAKRDNYNAEEVKRTIAAQLYR